MEAATEAPEPSIEDRIGAYLDQESKGGGGEEPETPDGSETPEPQPEKEPELAADADSAEADEDADAEAEPDADADPEVDSEGGEDEGVRTLSDVAELFEVKESEFLEQLQVEGADGSTATLASVIAAHKDEPAAVRVSKQIEGKVAELEQQKAAHLQAVEEEIGRLRSVTARVFAMAREAEAIDMDALKEEDPTEWAVKIAEKQQRDRALEASVEALETDKARHDTALRQERDEWAAAEARKLQDKMEIFREESTAKRAVAQITGYLTGVEGFSQDEMGDLADHRFAIVAWKAAQWDSLQKKTPLALKKVRSAKKLLPAGRARRDVAHELGERRKQQRARLERTGSVEDAAALMGDFLD